MLGICVPFIVWAWISADLAVVHAGLYIYGFLVFS